MIAEEMDFHHEATTSNVWRVVPRQRLLDHSGRLPRGRHDRVLVMQFFEGFRVTEADEIAPEGGHAENDRKSDRLLWRSALIHGFFHADPHPEHPIHPDSRIVLLDYGMVLATRASTGSRPYCDCAVRSDIDELINMAYKLDMLEYDVSLGCARSGDADPSDPIEHQG
jgi:predicted unusual protein kinase regulating ubiquinone biosynthesis (AarF/ABC1/UbiB family)